MDRTVLVLECSPDPDDPEWNNGLIRHVLSKQVQNRYTTVRAAAFHFVLHHTDSYQTGVGKAVEPDELDRVWDDYHDAVNMTASELETWAENPCSREASLTRAPIDRNLRLLRKPKREWDQRDIRDAKRTISFVARMSAGEQGDPVSDDCPLSRRDISLLNWAFDPRK
jgi:hypothetical protein